MKGITKEKENGQVDRSKEFTRMEQTIVDLFSDGAPHPPAELLEIVKPSSMNAVHAHLISIRKKLPAGETILCRVMNRRFVYQWVRLLPSANDGRS